MSYDAAQHTMSPYRDASRVQLSHNHSTTGFGLVEVSVGGTPGKSQGRRIVANGRGRKKKAGIKDPNVYHLGYSTTGPHKGMHGVYARVAYAKGQNGQPHQPKADREPVVKVSATGHGCVQVVSSPLNSSSPLKSRARRTHR
jgi:hypothetical protein